jgi:hypothetical protein
MNGEPTAVSPTERRFRQPLQGWEVAFLLALSTALIMAAVRESNRQYFGTDELYTALLVANPKFSEMWNTIRNGGELNPPFYFVLDWVVARLCGTGELALRGISMISVVLAGWVLFFTVRSVTGPRLAALASALVLGLSWEVFFFVCQARYYGLLFLLVSVGIALAVRFTAKECLRKGDYALVFLTHLAMVYTHIYGGFYSGALLVGTMLLDWLRGKPRWKLYLSVIAAWAAYLAWLPSQLQQFRSIRGAAYVPRNYNTLGALAGELAVCIPLALQFLLMLLVGTLELISGPKSRTVEEARDCSTPMGWSALSVLALAIMAVPCVTWAISLRQPGLFMWRYLFPCTAAWVLLTALILVAVFRLPQVQVSRPACPPAFSWLPGCAWFGVLAFSLLFQPLRGWKTPLRPAEPFADDDYGYKDLPMVFEDSWFFMPRAFYGKGRQYFLLTDHDAAEADPGYATKQMDRFFRAWYPVYGKARFVHFDNLPTEFLAVDDDLLKTFEWGFAHRPELKARLLGTRYLDVDHGEQRVYLVQRVKADK